MPCLLVRIKRLRAGWQRGRQTLGTMPLRQPTQSENRRIVRTVTGARSDPLQTTDRENVVDAAAGQHPVASCSKVRGRSSGEPGEGVLCHPINLHRAGGPESTQRSCREPDHAVKEVVRQLP